MTSFETFSVQEIVPVGDDTAVSDCIHVDATGPVHAAELALGKSLSPSGKAESIRAKVWRMGPDYAPICVNLYDPAG